MKLLTEQKANRNDETNTALDVFMVSHCNTFPVYLLINLDFTFRKCEYVYNLDYFHITLL